MIKGKGVSVGIGFGNIVILKNEIRKIEKNIVEDSDKELERFHKALEEVINETNQIVEKASIFDDYARSIINFRNRKSN